MLKKIIIREDNIEMGNLLFRFEDLFSDSFYSYSNIQADKFNNGSFCVNELFAHLAQPYMALDYHLANLEIEEIDVSNAGGEYLLYAIDIARNRGLMLSGVPFALRTKITIKAFFVKFASFLYLNYLMFKIPFKKDSIKVADKFAVLRQKSAIQKFKGFTDISKEYENPYDKESIYRLFPRFVRIKWVWKSFLESFSILKKMKDFYKPLTGKYSILQVDCFYQKRIVHALLYKHLMENYFRYFIGMTYCTGSNLDRFSVIEENIANKLGIQTICYPHGLEYGYKFPKGFSCDIFYANSLYAAKELNKLYNTTKFVYDEEVTRKMFELQNVSEHERHVVFFTEQQEYHVNKAILAELIPKLKENGIDVLVKLHPGDKQEHYAGCDFKFISDYNEAMTNNICISRKSTVLLEAVYNNSTSIAIITTNKDKAVFDTFPSLQSEKIIRTYNVKDLYNEIIKVC